MFIQDLIAGKPDVEHARTAAEAESTRKVVPAPLSLHLPWEPECKSDR
ncbi:hypothetical protein [Nocardia sp. bgisy134]